MTGALIRERIPAWESYASDHGLVLVGRGKWRNLLCDFHNDGKPSMRVNVESGGWVCMSCGAKGGDVLAHHMQRTSLGFIEAAKDLGAWDEDKAQPTERKARSLSASDAMHVISHELMVMTVVISDARTGLIPSDADWQRFLAGAGRIEALTREFR